MKIKSYHNIRDLCTMKTYNPFVILYIAIWLFLFFIPEEMLSQRGSSVVSIQRDVSHLALINKKLFASNSFSPLPQPPSFESRQQSQSKQQTEHNQKASLVPEAVEALSDKALEKHSLLNLQKYELVRGDYSYAHGEKVYRIRALRSFSDVSEGEYGGFVASLLNLSHEGNSWVYDNAKVLGLARVEGDAVVRDRAEVFNKAQIKDQAQALGDAKIRGSAQILGQARVWGSVSGQSKVSGSAQVRDRAMVRDQGQVLGFSVILPNGVVSGRKKVNDSKKDMDTQESVPALVEEQPTPSEQFVYTENKKRKEVFYEGKLWEYFIHE